MLEEADKKALLAVRSLQINLAIPLRQIVESKEDKQSDQFY
jgi:hypothetical protein